jgi:TonB family protein
MFDRAIALSLILSGCLSVVSCRTLERREAEGVGEIESSTTAYAAYVRGNCEEVREDIRREDVESWEPTELRHSMLLVSAFCDERAGRDREAIRTYRNLVQEAPLSFAADDARERLRILRLEKNDPDHARWLAEARDRAMRAQSSRVAVQRAPAEFPPLAQRAGIEGFAVVEFGVTPRGDTDAPVIVDSQPPLLFDGAALRAVREWRYVAEPDRDTTERMAIRIVFKPEERPPDPTPAPAEPSSSSDSTIE